MKPPQARIADFWCKLMHTEPMWPSHGQYQCRKCGRRHRVGWEEPLLPAPRYLVLECEVRDQSALVTATESRIHLTAIDSGCRVAKELVESPK